jgi:hypothetical protein
LVLEEQDLLQDRAHGQHRVVLMAQIQLYQPLQLQPVAVAVRRLLFLAALDYQAVVAVAEDTLVEMVVREPTGKVIQVAPAELQLQIMVVAVVVVPAELAQMDPIPVVVPAELALQVQYQVPV